MADVKEIVRFYCHVFHPNGPSTVTQLRWHLFETKGMEGEMLPPTFSTLLPHIKRVNFVCRRDKSYTETLPVLPSPVHNGWIMSDGLIKPEICLDPPAPKAVLELKKCSCKSGCETNRCSCRKAQLPCTSLCACYTIVCHNSSKDEFDEDEEEDT